MHALSIRIQHQVSTINQNANEIIFERKYLNDPKSKNKTKKKSTQKMSTSQEQKIIQLSILLLSAATEPIQ